MGEGSFGPASDEEIAESDHISMVQETDLLFDDEIEGWFPQLKLDGLEKRRRRVKKMKKLRSPYPCSRRKRVNSCIHSRASDAMTGEVYEGKK